MSLLIASIEFYFINQFYIFNSYTKIIEGRMSGNSKFMIKHLKWYDNALKDNNTIRLEEIGHWLFIANSIYHHEAIVKCSFFNFTYHCKFSKGVICQFLSQRFTILFGLVQNPKLSAVSLLFFNWYQKIGSTPILFLLQLIGWNQYK